MATPSALGQARSSVLATARVLEAGPAWMGEREVERAVEGMLTSVRAGRVGPTGSVILTTGRAAARGVPAPRVVILRLSPASVVAAGEGRVPRSAAARVGADGATAARAAAGPVSRSGPPSQAADVRPAVLLRVTIEHVAN